MGRKRKSTEAAPETRKSVKLERWAMTHLCPGEVPGGAACPFCVPFDKDWVGDVVRARLLERVHTNHLRAHTLPCALCACP